jgi:hypothetical protein
MIACPDCGAPQYPGALFCDSCGAAVHPAARAYLAAQVARSPVVHPAPGDRETAPARPTGDPPPVVIPRVLRASFPHHEGQLTFRSALVQVGRADPDAGYVPELDLTPYGGQERGVSRRHATIQWVEGGFVLIDQHSGNGTWLDGARLVAGFAYQIPPTATVRFGGLLVQLSITD